MRPRTLASRSLARALILAVILSAALSTGLLPIERADLARAGTAETMESALLGWINDARAARGLHRLRVDTRLAALSGDRVASLAVKNQFSHEVAGCLSCQLADRGIAWDLQGEVLASNSWPWGLESARVAFDGWKGSPTHWNILMGAKFDTVGIGAAKATNGTTYVGAILIDAPGYTPAAPRAKPAPVTTVKAPSAPQPAPRSTPRPTLAPALAPAPVPGTARYRLIAF